MAFIAPMVRILLEMLLALGVLKTYPTEPCPALRALHLGAATADQGNLGTAFLVRTRFSAVLEIDLIESVFHQSVLLCDLCHQRSVLDKHIDPVNVAAFSWVDMFLTIDAKVMLTVVASAGIFIYLNHSNASTSWNWTPAHVVHISNSILNAKLFILLQHIFVEANSLDVHIIQILATIGIGALNVAYLARVDLCFDHVLEALSAE